VEIKRGLTTLLVILKANNWDSRVFVIFYTFILPCYLGILIL